MPLRLAIVFERVDPSRGGAETYVVDLCRRLVAAGLHVDLYANDWNPDVLPSAVRGVRVAAPGRTRAGRIWSFARNAESALARADHDATIGLINTWGQDILIPQGGVHPASLDHNARRFPHALQRLAYRAAKRLNPRFGLYRSIEARQYAPGRLNRVVAVSHMVEGHLRRFYGVPGDRIRVIPNAIDTARLEVSDPPAVRASFRREHGLAPEDLVALFVAHNFRLKGLAPLLKALHLRKRRGFEVRPLHLLVCGGGKPAPFRPLIRRLGLEREVHLLGFLPDVREAFHASDLFVLPSYYDPCSLVVFEALACGLPVVTTACNGAGELITQGREGYVVSAPDDLAGLATALDLLSEDRRRRTMSTAAARLGREQSFDRHVGRLLALIEEVAAARAGNSSTATVRTDTGSPATPRPRAEAPPRSPLSEGRTRA